MIRILRARRSFVIALLNGAVIAGGLLIATAPRHEVVADFRDAAGLVAGNDVRIHGVVAGTVVSVSAAVDRNSGAQYAVATLAIDSAHWPLHQGSRVAVKPKGVLSSMYVEVDPTVGGTVLPSDYVFATSQTTSPISLDVLSNEFTPDVRSAIQTQIQQGTVAFGNGGSTALGGALDNTDPLLQAALPTTAVLADRSPQLEALNSEFDAVSAKLATEDANLRGLIHNSDITLGAIAAKQEDLRGTLTNASATLGELDGILRGEQGNLQAIFAKGPQALALTKANADALLPLVTAVNPHVAGLDQLLTELVTATGFNQGTMNGIDTLRADGTTPPDSHGSSACGGEPSQQANVCPGQGPQGAP